ncbi:RDD family protein [Desulfopila sp. IMCC35008]|uniref:RDD family protein n=1 Tax=Desulfopila sp. IMCC35008 TaxID=2653858 RepID=UPI0013D4FB2F|nr:RDD family protein [Desulfopila sp. IMCC35008]
MDDKYTIRYAGQLQPEIDKYEAIKSFSILFKVSADKAESFLSSPTAQTIKSGLSSREAGIYKKKLESIGLQVQVTRKTAPVPTGNAPESNSLNSGIVSPLTQETTKPTPQAFPLKENVQTKIEKNDNPYAAPTAELLADENRTTILASRGKRLGAVIIDTIISIALILPLMYFTGGFDIITSGTTNYGYNALLGVFGIVFFFLIHGRYLALYGQTIGKKMVGIKITDLQGNLPSFKRNILVRYGFTSVIGNIPFIGGLVSIIDVLFIFGKERRCLHDRVAGTMVLEA